MASGDTLLQLEPGHFIPEGGNNPAYPVACGLAPGLAFPPGVAAGAVAFRRLPKTASLATGLTFKLLVAVDPNTPEVSKASVWEVSAGMVGSASAYYPMDVSGAGTANTGTVTLASAAGKTKEVSIAVPTANLGGTPVADTWMVFRVRRLGANSSDTSKVRNLLLGVAVLDT